MTIQKICNGDSVTLAVGERLDTQTAPELEAAIEELLPGIKQLTLDLSTLTYISSAGLRVLLKAQKSLFGNLTITGVGANIMEVFELTGFTDILTIR